jgi:hypothetical protein
MFNQDPYSKQVTTLTAKIEAATGRNGEVGLAQKVSRLSGKFRCTAYVQGTSHDEDEPEFEGWGRNYTSALYSLAEVLGIEVEEAA